MNSIKKNLFVFIFASLFFILPFVSLAQLTSTGGATVCDPKTSGKICNPVPYNSLTEFIQVLLEGVLKIGIPIIALAIIYSGFLFVAAQGNSEKLETAKKALMYTLIGAAILLGSWAIAKLISETVLAL